MTRMWNTPILPLVLAIFFIAFSLQVDAVESNATNGSSADATNASEHSQATTLELPKDPAQRWHIACSNLTHLQDRVACRIEVHVNASHSPDLWFVPEDCLLWADSPRYHSCMQEYTLLQKCRGLATPLLRDSCARKQLNYNATGKQMKQTCLGGVLDNQSACLAEARKALLSLIKFRINELEHRAIASIDKGASVQRVENFVAAMESSKIRLDATAVDGVAILTQARASWQRFRQDASSDIATHRIRLALNLTRVR